MKNILNLKSDLLNPPPSLLKGLSSWMTLSHPLQGKSPFDTQPRNFPSWAMTPSGSFGLQGRLIRTGGGNTSIWNWADLLGGETISLFAGFLQEKILFAFLRKKNLLTSLHEVHKTLGRRPMVMGGSPAGSGIGTRGGGSPLRSHTANT